MSLRLYFSVNPNKNHNSLAIIESLSYNNISKGFMMKKAPRFLNLFKIKLPLPAIVSISHRISGVVLSASLIWVAYTLYFLKVCNQYSWQWLTSHPAWYLSGYLILAAFFFHMCSGIRHIWDDFHHTHTLNAAMIGSRYVILISVLLTLLFMLTRWAVS